jgi:DNA helicase-2/ATP-dependent DNA helicase PcrA
MQTAIFDDVRDGEGHTCVEALAGAAKSTSLIESLNYVPKKAANSILVTSFSVACVADLKKKGPPWTVDLRTMNSLGFKALRDNGYTDLKVDKDRVWNVLDDLMPMPERMSRENRRGFNAVRESAKQLVDLAKGHLADDSEAMYDLCDEFSIEYDVPEWLAPALQDRFGVEPGGELLGVVFNVLEACKDISNGIVDFNDQLWLPIVYDLPFESYERIFLDEAQDTSMVQIEMLCRCLTKTSRVCMFGDRNQALYHFRGAGMGMEPFINRLAAKRLPLSISYRCPKNVVTLAHRIVPELEAAPGAPDGIVEDIDYARMLSSLKMGDTVLSRRNSSLLRLFMTLLRLRIPVGLSRNDIGKSLTAFITKLDAKNAGDVHSKTKEWAEKETKRRTDKDPDAKVDFINDRVECIEILCDNANSLQDVFDKLEKLLVTPTGGRVLLSTVHAAKGLEWDRVFMLDFTFPINTSFWMQYAHGGSPEEWAAGMAEKVFADDQAERAVWYVSVTRSKRELYLVGAP